MIAMFRKHFTAGLAAFALIALSGLMTPASAVEIQEVETLSGLKFWLVEDYTVPIVSLSFEFSGGASNDPEGKAGLATMLAAMMDEGAGDIDTAALKAELEERGIDSGFSAGRDDISGGMRMLASETGRAFELLSMMINRPRFEADSFERVKAALIASIERSQTEPRTILGRKLRSILFDGHPYERSIRGTVESISNVEREDVIAQHKALFARDNLVLGVVGAIKPEEAASLIDAAFSELPEKPSVAPIPEVEPNIGEDAHIEFDSPQTIVTVALPGIKRANPEFFAAYLVNQILGRGTFSSRLYDEIREKRGLVYSVGSDLTTLDHSAYFSAGFAAAPGDAAEAKEIMLSEITRMAKAGPTAEELESAKKYVIGSYAINNLDTSSRIADVLVGLQTADLGSDYINTRRERINSVTLEETREIAKKLLSANPTVVTIGPGQS